MLYIVTYIVTYIVCHRSISAHVFTLLASSRSSGVFTTTAPSASSTSASVGTLSRSAECAVSRYSYVRQEAFAYAEASKGLCGRPLLSFAPHLYRSDTLKLDQEPRSSVSAFDRMMSGQRRTLPFWIRHCGFFLMSCPLAATGWDMLWCYSPAHLYRKRVIRTTFFPPGLRLVMRGILPVRLAPRSFARTKDPLRPVKPFRNQLALQVHFAFLLWSIS